MIGVRDTIHVCVGACLSAALLLSPVALGDTATGRLAAVASIIGFAPAVWVCRDRSQWAWGLGGFCMGAFWHAYAVWSFLDSSGVLGVLTPGLYGIFYAIIFLVGGFLGSGSTTGIPMSLAGACALLQCVCDLVGGPTVPLTLGLVRLGPPATLPVELFGPTYLDSFTLYVGATVATVTGGRAARRLFGAAAFHAVVAGLLLSARPTSVRDVLVHLIQPRIDPRDFRASGWSLATRSAVRGQFARLTARAARRPDGLIVWPEGGTGSADLQVPALRTALAESLQGTGSEALISTTLLSTRDSFNAVGLVSAGAVVASTVKQRPVPIVESALSTRPPRILNTKYAKVGVLVCFDGVFASIARKLRDDGAEMLVMTTDNASFHGGTALEVHTLAARLIAASVALPMAIGSNAGPSAIIDSGGRVLDELGLGRVGVLSGTVAVASAARHPRRWEILRHGSIFLVLGLLARRVRNRARARWLHQPRRRDVVLLSAVTMGAIAGGALFELCWLAWRSGTGIEKTGRILYQRILDSPEGADGIGPAYRQRSPESCGAAALALALTHAGQETTEEELVRRCRLPVRPLSLAELHDCARSMGFAPSGVEATWNWLVARGSRPSLLHLKDHYVTALGAQHDRVMVFDPARGAVLAMPRGTLEARWTGRAALAVDLGSPYGVLGHPRAVSVNSEGNASP